MKKITLFLVLAITLSACSVTEQIYLNDTRAEQLKRYGYSSSNLCEFVFKNKSDSTQLVTFEFSDYALNVYRVNPGGKLSIEVPVGFYQVDTENYIFTSVDSWLGYDIEFLPAHRYKNTLQ